MGYSTEQMDQWRDELTVTPDNITSGSVYKLIRNHRIMGYYAYRALAAEIVKLDSLFISPDHIGSGMGEKLANNFLIRAKGEGFNKVTLDADPNAEGFYVSVGFVTVGKKETSVPGRYMPIMEKEL